MRHLVRFLEGGDRTVLEELRREMDALADGLRFEEAARVRDRIARLETTVAAAGPWPGSTATSTSAAWCATATRPAAWCCGCAAGGS